MGRWLGIAAAALVTAASWGAAALPVPAPADGGMDAGPLVAQAPPPERARPPQAPPEKPPATPSVHVLMASDRSTIRRLHDANQLQIRMGRLAQERGASRAVKALGRKLVSEHTAAEQKLDAYLRKRGSSLAELATTTTSPDADHELLATRTGAEFDRTFALQIVADHTRTIDMLQSARIATYDDLLRDLYDQTIITEEAHKRAAQDVMPSLAHS